MKDFAAIDFETANYHQESVCSVGIVVVRNGVNVDSFYSLIHPEPNEYYYQNIRVHGIHKEDTENAPLFPEVWQQIAPKIAGLPLVAHNKVFDENCLKKVFKTYQMDYPNYQFYCTCIASRKVLGKRVPNHKLDTVAAYLGYPMGHHHHALADAEACAEIAKRIL